MLVGPNEFTDFYKLLISNYTILSFTSWLYFFKLHLFVFEYVECMMCVCVCGWGIMPQSMWMSEDNYGAVRSLLSRVPEIELWLAGSAANVFTH